MALLIARIAAAHVVAYLLGGIPWSLIIGRRFFGIDPRDHGSGNLGATNTLRVLGARAGAAVFALDIAKGAAAVAMAMLIVPPGVLDPVWRDWVLIGAGMAAIVGHSYSPYAKFAGGKGVATAAGAIAVLMPLAWPILFLSFVLVVALSRMVSLGSVLIAIEFPLLILALYRDRPAFVTFAFVAAALVVWRHRANIGRIIRGEESKISLSSRGSATRGPANADDQEEDAS